MKPPHRSTETENTNKNEGREEVQSDLLHDLLDWLQEVQREFWLMKVLQQSLGETQSKEVKTLPVLLMNYQWSREQKWNRVWVSIVSTVSSSSSSSTSSRLAAE